jgi:hypothetical protein
MGDTPYFEAEVSRLDSLIRDLNAEPLAFVVHVGDITSGQGPCTDAWFEARKEQFARLRHPFALLPGDNDWTDCHRSGFDPVERLARWRELFCYSDQLPFRIERQSGDYCEHMRWEFQGWLFVTLNVQGSNNNLGRNAAMDAEHAARMKAVHAWVEDSERLFRQRAMKGLALLMQANPFLEPRAANAANGYGSLLGTLRGLGTAYPGKVLLVNGDTHRYRDDEPLPGVRRIEVYGSPFVGWLRGSVLPEELRIESGGLH